MFKTAAAGFAALTLALVPVAVRAANIDIDATSSSGVSQDFGAGTYRINFLNGAFQAFNYGPTVNPGYSDALFVSYGGNTYTYFLQGQGGGQELFSNATDSLSAYQNATTFQQQVNGGAATSVAGPIQFTLGTVQDVNFTVADSYYADNSGGVSLGVNAVNTVSAAPEPGAWALMFLGVGMIGWMLGYRKRVIEDHKEKLALIP